MENQVRYTVTANDMLSGKLQGMNAQARGLEGTLATVGTTATSMWSKLMSGLGMLGIGFAAFKGFELIHEGIDAFEKLDQARAQVTAGLISTSGAAGLTEESLTKMASNMSAKMNFSKSETRF